MDLTQRKLSRSEWNSIEKPVSTDELRVIRLIHSGYDNVNIKRNTTLTIIQHLKVVDSDELDLFIFTRYIQKQLIGAIKYARNCPITYFAVPEGNCNIRKSDLIRISNTDTQLEEMKKHLFEFVLINILKTTLKSREKQEGDWVIGFFTLQTLLKYNITSSNRLLQAKLTLIVRLLTEETDMKQLLYRSAELIERNPLLLRYADEELYDHQKRLFTLFKHSKGRPQLVLYIAPTGTGKTLSPIGLTKEYKVIFVCAARHVGLALAKAAISANTKVAFAFGCNDASDIRLHYSAAKEYTRDRKSGAISKVDNSLGDRVELIISDIKSYIPAMHYMCSFNDKDKIITYWDEPTISLDYEDHPCHEIIKKNWIENIIPNMVLSSATLPCEEELATTLSDFMSRFDKSEITTIVSYDCKKTITIINKSGYAEAPHFMYEQYADAKECAVYCLKNKTLLRYIDLASATEFIKFMNEHYPSAILQERFKIESQITDISMINMLNIKTYYLTLLKNIDSDKWSIIYKRLTGTRVQKHVSNVLVSTNDAHTLTDGPTIFLADDVHKIGKFCLQRANIPANVLGTINDTIVFNSVINKKIMVLTKDLEDMTAKDDVSGNDKKLSDVSRGSPEVKKIRKDLEELYRCIKTVQLPEKYVPNMPEHLKIYGSLCKTPTRTFKPSVTEDDIEKIMLIDEIDDIWKLLLIMGIGVFATHDSVGYTEIMKSLAHEQKLYLIIASTDFIYGTNYQFCHGYIAADLEGMTQEKTIQALGRVGRNKLQHDYTVRFRNDNLIHKLFKHNSFKPEVENMAKLFNS
jgi:hypothetical protein